jgi:hypothetical protein
LLKVCLSDLKEGEVRARQSGERSACVRGAWALAANKSELTSPANTAVMSVTALIATMINPSFRRKIPTLGIMVTS